MEDFINKLVEIMKGTGANMKRGLDGTAMEEMRQSARDRNADLIDNAYPGGVPKYMEDQQNQTPEDRKLFGNPYTNAIRALLSKQ